jgi:hypothetical protein
VEQLGRRASRGCYAYEAGVARTVLLVDGGMWGNGISGWLLALKITCLIDIVLHGYHRFMAANDPSYLLLRIRMLDESSDVVVDSIERVNIY